MAYSFEEAVHRVVSSGAFEVGAEFFTSMARQLAEVLGADAVLIGELQPDCRVVDSLGAVVDGEVLDAFAYALQNTPCCEVMGRSVCTFDDAMTRFPDDQMLVDLRIQGYVGVPLFSKDTSPSGIVVAMWRTPVPEASFASAVIKMFASRAAAEIDRIRLEREQQVLRARLAQRNADLTNVVMGLSHDLKSALVNIAGFSGELAVNQSELAEALAEANLTDRQRGAIDELLAESSEFLDYMSSGSNRIASMLQGIRELTRAGLEVAQPAVVDMHQLVLTLFKSSRFSADRMQVKLSIDGTLPKCYADASHLTRIVANLIDNAIKFSSGDGGELTVSGKISSGRVTYQIADDGPGIEKEQIDKVFNLFHRTLSTDGVPGQGMGLAVARRLILVNSGTIDLRSELGEGTTVRLRLPLPPTRPPDAQQLS